MRAGRGLITRYTGESPSPKAHLRGRNVVSMGLGVAAVFDATKWAKKVVFDMEMPRPGETDADCPRETARESLPARAWPSTTFCIFLNVFTHYRLSDAAESW